MRLHFAFLLLLLLPAAGLAQRKEIVELGRDLALLQEEVRSMKLAQDERLSGIEASLKTILDQINSTNRQVTVLDSGLRERVERSVTGQMSALGGKVDGLAQEFSYVRESVAEVNSRLNKLQQQVVDLSNVIRTMQAARAPRGRRGARRAASRRLRDVALSRCAARYVRRQLRPGAQRI